MNAAAPLRVVILSIGDELVAGKRQDANGPWLAAQLARAGVRCTGIHALPDDEAVIVDAMQRASASARVIVVGGGLGPTEDDRTRMALAALTGATLSTDDAAAARVRARLEGMGRTPLAMHFTQAKRPEGWTWIDNPVGTAEGLMHDDGSTLVAALPGVPDEYRAMARDTLLPRIASMAGAEAEATAVVSTAELPESHLASRVALVGVDPTLTLGWYPHQGEVELHVRGPSTEIVEAFVERVLAELDFDAWRPSARGTRIEHEVVEQLAARGLRMATAESLTGGQIAQTVTAVAGASSVFVGGYVTYASQHKVDALGVPASLIATEGAVSEAVARAMARGARERSGADVAIAVTGSAGPEPAPGPRGGAPVPVGVVYMALDAADTTMVAQTQRAATRALIRRRTTVNALNLIRRWTAHL